VFAGFVVATRKALACCGDGTNMLEVSLFGKLEVKRDGTPVEIASRPVQLLLAYLVLNAGTPHRRDRLAGVLWPDSDEIHARNNLRQTLWRLRQAIGEETILADRTSVGWNPNAEYRSDLAILQGGGIEEPSTDALIRSVSVYDDILLPGFYDDWVVLEQELWQAIFEERMQRLMDRLCEEARWREVLEWAERWIAHGYVPEPAYRALMMAHAALGDRAGIAVVYQRCVEVLARELGVEPSPETQSLFQTLTSGGGVQGAPVERVEPIRAVNLPHQPTPFVGREEELSQLGALLADPAIKLVTILGPGGIGKTRLAIEAARTRSEAYADGVHFVPLDSLDDPELIVSSIAAALGFSFYTRDQRERWEFDPQKEQLLAYMQDKQLLLILDNLEHMLDRPEGVAGLVSDILHAAPSVELLATSRERLSLYGETVFALDGLTYPDRPSDRARGMLAAQELEDIATYPAVQLFLQTARRVQHTFELTANSLVDVIDICHLVDGLPLGIELAAAWVELFSPAEIAAEIRNSLDFLEVNLRDTPDRQHSIRSVVEASWQRLDRSEREIFQRLSVFRGGFTREAAHNMAGASLQTLMALMHKSLLRSELAGRYQMHEFLRYFGQERLAELPSEEAAAKDRHCAYYAAFLKSKEADLIGANQGEALAAIAAELGNVRAAWDWAVAQGKLEEIDLAMESLCEFYRIGGELDEGYETFYPAALALGWEGFSTERDLSDSKALYHEAIQLLDEAVPPGNKIDRRQEILGKVLARYGRFYCESPGRAWKASQVRQDSLRILSRLGAPREMAYLLRYLGHVGHTPPESRNLYRRALVVLNEIDDHRGQAEILYRLGWVATQLGEYNEAERLYLDSLAWSERIDRREMVANCQLDLGYVYWALGNYQVAEQQCRESFTIFAEIGYPSQKALSLRYLARIAMVLEDYQTAKRHLRDSLAIYQEIGLRGMRALALGELGYVALLESDLLEARTLALESLEICEGIENRQGIVESLNVLGTIALRLEDFQEAEARFERALQTAMEAWTPAQALHILLSMANLLAAEREQEQALEVASLVQQHQASWQWTKDQAVALVEELTSELPAGAARMAMERGRAGTIERMAGELVRG
jgi:predicted ATPase/DNA-binding SARP family transcriptional activator